MNAKEYALLPLFEKFLKDSNKGKRLKADGTKIKKQTINNQTKTHEIQTRSTAQTGTQKRRKLNPRLEIKGAQTLRSEGRGGPIT